MKVLNVNHLLDPVTGGGTAERTFQMSRFLAKTGVGCNILTTSLGLTDDRRMALQGVEVYDFPCLSQRFYVPRTSYRIIRKYVENSDVVHLMGHWTVLNAMVYLAARQTETPYVLCPAGALAIYGRSKRLKAAYNCLVGRRMIANADALIAITSEEVEQFKALGVTPGRIRLIPNGIDEAEFSSRDDAKFRQKYHLGEAPFILFLGRLNHIKGPDLLLEAFAGIVEKFPQYHLVFAGPDGGMEGMLREATRKEGLQDRVHFVGYVGGIDKSHAYHAAELLVIPSRQEAMSIVVLEAGITATPVLLTDRCGFNDVEAIGGGKVVEATRAGLTGGLLEMLTAPSPERVELGDNLRRYVRQKFSWDMVVNDYIDLYESILAAR